METALRLDDGAARLRSALNARLQQTGHRLELARERLRGLTPRERLAGHQSRLAALLVQMQDKARNRLRERQLGLGRLGRTLQALSPGAVLARGYALARALPELTVIREAEGMSPGRSLRLQLARGSLDCRVEKIWKEEGRPSGQGDL